MGEEILNPNTVEPTPELVEPPAPPPFDVGLANRVIEDSIKLTASQNYDDDKIHVMRSGNEINIEVKTPDRAVPVFSGRDSELHGPENITLFRPGAWVKYLIDTVQELTALKPPTEDEKPSEFQAFDDGDLFKKAD